MGVTLVLVLVLVLVLRGSQHLVVGGTMVTR